MLDSLDGSYRREGWESRLVHLDGNRIVAADVHDHPASLAMAAFPVVAPRHFWNHVAEHVNGVDDVSG